MKKFISKISRRNRYLCKIGIITLVCLLAAVFLAKPVYRAFRDWRIEGNASEASEALAAGNYPEARRLAMSVLKLQKDRHDMLLVLQQSMEALNDPNAVSVSRMLMTHPDATEQDRLRGFQVSCAELPLPTVTRIWLGLGKEKANTPAYLTPFTQRLIDQGLAGEATKLLFKRNNLDLEPGLRLQAARALLKFGRKQQIVRAQFEISDIMRDGGSLALPAYRLLAQIPPADFRSAYFPELEEWVKQQDGATIEDQLLALIQRSQRLPGHRAGIAQSAIDQFAESDPAAVARWLIQADMADRALELLPAEQCLNDDERFRSRADALIALERWPETREWLATPPDSFPLVELHAMRVLCDDTPGDPTKHGKAWGLAMLNAGSKSNPNDYLELQQRMRDAGLQELAKEAMVEAVRTGRGRLPYWAQVRELLPWLKARQDGPAMLDLCSVMSKLEPSNAEVAIESLDLACIFGRIQPSSLVVKLQKIIEHMPEILNAPRFNELLATAQLAAGKPEEALKVLAGSQDRPAASTRVIAVAALANAMLGEQGASAELLERVDWKQMLREEKEFFRALLDKLSAPGTTEPIGDQFDPRILPPSDDPIEDPSVIKALPPVTKEFQKRSEPKELPTISDSVEAEFKPKE